MLFRESENVELKVKVVDAIKLGVVAFANGRGGTLYVGVADNGDVEGLTDVHTDFATINNMLRDGIKPDITMFAHTQIERVEDKDIIAIHVTRGTQRPYYLTGKGIRPEGVYIRYGVASVPASDTLIRKMIRETDGESYEEMRSTVQNLTFSHAEIEFSRRNTAFGEIQMATLGLVNTDKIYTNLAHLLSDQCTHTIKAAIFQDTTQNIFVDRREFGGSLFTQLNDAYQYLELNNKLGATYDKLIRIDTRQYPEVALREALLNAIVHREYATSNSILIKIFSDRMEFISPGALVAGVEMDDIMIGYSACRNLKLASIFYRLQLIESYGTGITKIFDAYKATNRRPKIEVTSNIFKMVLPNLNPDTKFSQDNGNDKNMVAEEIHRHYSVDKTTSSSNKKDQTEKIIGYIQANGSITRREAETLLDLSQTATGLVLREMTEKGKLHKKGKGKKIVYYLSLMQK